MESETEEAEILRHLLNRLREAFELPKARHAVAAAQAAYMKAAYDVRDLERSRQRLHQIRGSEA